MVSQGVRRLPRVGPHVLLEVVRPREPFGALAADEPLLPGVNAQVALQLVGSRERLAAEDPAAGEGPHAGVPAQMGLQVGRLAVDLAAAGHVAHVVLPFGGASIATLGGRILATRALAFPAATFLSVAGMFEKGRRKVGRGFGMGCVGLWVAVGGCLVAARAGVGPRSRGGIANSRRAAAAAVVTVLLVRG